LVEKKVARVGLIRIIGSQHQVAAESKLSRD